MQFAIPTHSSSEYISSSFALVEITSGLIKMLRGLEAGLRAARQHAPELYGLEQFDYSATFLKGSSDVSDQLLEINNWNAELCVFEHPIEVEDDDELRRNYCKVFLYASDNHVTGQMRVEVMWEMCEKHTDDLCSTICQPIELFYQAADGTLDMPFSVLPSDGIEADDDKA
jgi:hypothetical protein